jgi:hypothetical protein
MAPPSWSAAAGDGGGGTDATGHSHSSKHPSLSAALLAGIPRLGATPLPPQTTTPVVGEVLLFLPSIHIRSQAAPRPPPTRLQVRVAWWGEDAGKSDGTLLLPRVLEGKSVVMAGPVRGVGGRPLEPRSRENACLFPVRVEEGTLWAYLGDMVRGGTGLWGWVGVEWSGVTWMTD